MEVTIKDLYDEIQFLKKEINDIKRKDENISKFVQKLKNNDFLISEEEFMECLN